MKKRILALILAALAALSLVSCGTQSADEEAVKAVAEHVETAKKSLAHAVPTENADFELLARGTTFVYKYTYKADATDEWRKSTIANIKKVTKEQKDFYKASLVILQQDCPEIEAIAYEFYDSNGELLYSYEVK